MLKQWRRPILATVVVAFLVAVPIALLGDHSWGSYHWARSSNPLTLAVGDNMSANWDSYLNEAISDWNRSSVLELVKTTGGTRPKNCRPTSGRIEACNAQYGNTGWLGIAQIWASGNHITQAIAKMNDTYFNTATYNTPAWRRLVVCQEIAHDFGLDHQDENFNNPNLGSCMDYTSDPDGPPSNEHPNQHDYEQLETIYSHLESAATISPRTSSAQGRGAAPPAFHDLEVGDNPGQWGRLVRQSRDGGISVYELDFGGGHKIITVVTWTLEMAAKNRALMGHDR